MKILLLSTGGKIGGEETFTLNLAKELLNCGHEVEVAYGGDIQRQNLEKNGIKVCPVDITSRSVAGIIKAAKRIARYANDNRFDIIHAQAIGPALMGVMAKRLYKCRIPWIWHNHGITDFAYKYIVRHLNKLDLIIANSDYVKETLKGHGVKANKIKRIHNGISYNDFKASSEEKIANRKSLCKEINIPENDFLSIYVGRLSPEKGVEVFLEGFENFYTDNRDAQCILVGDGAQKQGLQAQINNYKSKNNIHFLGFRSDIRQLVSGCDALVLPSHIETFSLTTLQAFASGTVCIATDVGGTPEQILDKFSGILFPDKDAKALAEALQNLKNDKDYGLYLAENARRLSENYLNVERMTRDIIKVYNDLKEEKI